MRKPSAQQAIRKPEHDENEDDRIYKVTRNVQKNALKKHERNRYSPEFAIESTDSTKQEESNKFPDFEEDSTVRKAAQNLINFKNEVRNAAPSKESSEYEETIPKKTENSSVEMQESSFLKHCPDRRSIERELIRKNDKASKAIDINPISSVTTTQNSFKRIDEEQQQELRSEDPLTELRNIARIEADILKSHSDRIEETTFSPPVSPFKAHHPLQYLRKAVTKEEKGEKSKGGEKTETSSDVRQKVKKIIKENSFETDGTIEEAEPKSAMEFDDAKFNYNQETKMFYCPWDNCGKCFPSLSRIKRHYIIHTKEKPFKCLNKDCSRRFSRKDNMLQHYRVHCPFASSRNS